MQKAIISTFVNEETKITEFIPKTLGDKTSWMIENRNEIEVSDGYHTMKELYEHRHALFAALLRIYHRNITSSGSTTLQVWKSRLHADGTMFEGSFIAGLRRRHLDRTETQLSYHLPLEWWDKVDGIELPNAPVWDGHTSQDVINRLNDL